MRAITRRSALLTAAAGAVLRPEASQAAEEMGQFGPAPDFTGISNWLNSTPLTMAGLRGKVVLIDFWTYSCINCLRTLPYVTRWYDTYKDRGLVVVGVHTPEFGFERVTANVETAIKRFGIKYPVAQDNAMATWRAYSNIYWPGEYLIDRNGQIVMKHFGEGKYDETENAIRTLLEAGPAVPKDNGVDLSRIGSPEMYFGLARVAMMASTEAPRAGEVAYTAPSSLPLNHFALQGTWNLSDENATLAKDGGQVVLGFHSAKCFLVASSPTPVTLQIVVDGQTQPSVTVQESRMYTLFDSTDYGIHFMTLSIPKSGFEAFTFTFG
jgi:thiol-disulfide isomerase/thioredoxin